MVKEHKVKLVAILEPMISAVECSKVARRLGFNSFLFNRKKNSELVISEKWKSSQCLTVEVETSGSSSSLFLSIVYAKCSVADRRDLWQDLFYFATIVDKAVAGDFNVVVDQSERIGGRNADLLAMR